VILVERVSMTPDGIVTTQWEVLKPDQRHDITAAVDP
jgi:hypothetical protein